MFNLQDLIGAIDVRMAEIRLSLALGNAVNIESYHRMVGQYLGLQEALDTINILLKKEEEDER
jgi:hypothetical protein